MPEKCPNSDRLRPLVAIESKNTLPNRPIKLSHPNRYGDTFLINDEEERKKIHLLGILVSIGGLSKLELGK